MRSFFVLYQVVVCLVVAIWSQEVSIMTDSVGSVGKDTLDDDISATDASAVIPKSSSASLPPMYVLNLDRSPDRWSKVSRQMSNAGLDVERIPAIDGRKLSKEELHKESNLLAMYLQPRGVIGCYLSHKKFWQKVVDEKLERAIIFEDDVQLVPDFKEKLNNNLKRFNMEQDQDFDVIMLGAIGRVHPEGKDGVGGRFFSIYIGGKRPLKIINDYRYQPRRPAGTHAYMVSYKGAQKLLKLCSKASYHVDLECWRHLDLDLTMFHPMLAYQTFEDTELTDVTTDRGKLAEKWMSTALYKKAIEYTRDPNTKQPWTHVLAEPLIQIGPKGPVLTVERHTLIVSLGLVSTLYLEYHGKHKKAAVTAGATVAFMTTVRGLIWLLMNWK